jgi:acyl-CoA reductase-like NAD-dependent aldehyde dehydrogenase
MNSIIKTISPIDGEVYVERNQAGTTEVSAALESAEKAQQQWSQLSLADRQVICTKAVEAFVSNKATIAEELSWQMGRPILYAAGEVVSFADRSHHMISIAEACLADITTSDKQGFSRYIKRNPVGVVLVIAPWNYPLHTPINAIMPALLAGNSVILKHSSQTPLCAERIVEAFNAAGLPEGVFQYLHMSHEQTESLIKETAIRSVAFTGSVSAGRSIERAAAGRFINVGLELGGKDPAYVRADADINYAVESTVDGAFFNSGQSCCGIERIYVHESVYETFLEKYIDLVYKYKLGRSDDPKTTLGPLVNSASAEFVRQQISEAVSKGATVNIDPAKFQQFSADSAYLAPQVVTDVDHSMRIMTEESFGPVVGIMTVASDNEALTLMNDSQFGLSASIFSNNIDEAIELGEQVQTGTFFVNRCDYLDPELAWTGVKNTGRGCTLSSQGFSAFTQLKSFHIKRR